jgi:hypothetical protein
MTSAAMDDSSKAGTALATPERRHAIRALGVLAFWAVCALPALLGAQRCTFAILLHRPCPGCGMTRAMRLLEAGDVAGSLHMHPFAVPVSVANLFFAVATVWVTFASGSPTLVHKSRFGKASLVVLAVVYAATLVFWVMRSFGAFGGPVSVY